MNTELQVKQDDWAQKDKQQQERIDNLTAELSQAISEAKRNADVNASELQKWKDMCDQKDKMITEVKEGEQRLKEVQDLELKRQQAAFDKELDDLKSQLNSKEVYITDLNRRVEELEQSIGMRDEEIVTLKDMDAQSQSEFRSEIQSQGESHKS